jgi:hypothetical protein
VTEYIDVERGTIIAGDAHHQTHRQHVDLLTERVKVGKKRGLVQY